MKTRATCRACEGALTPVLSLGDMYVSGFPSPGESDGIKAPLDLVLCRRCHLLQLRHTVPAESLYQNYWYRSGTNQSMRNALSDLATKSEQLAHLQPGDSVLDIGCNDGTLLASYRTGGVYRIGFDPACNLTPYSSRVAERVVVGFFDAKVFQNDPGVGGRRPKIVTSIAMFYDLEDPNKFVVDVKNVLHPDGVWVVQMSYLPLMLKTNEIGNICHEHLEYYSLHSLEYLLCKHGFQVVDAELNDVNGGSLRAYIRSLSADVTVFGDSMYRDLARRRVQALRDRETNMALDDVSAYSAFAFWAERIKKDVVGFIQEQVHNNKKVYVYGASTKGNTLLQYYGLDHTLITAATERNPDKWGKQTVGTRIPIISEAEARSVHPDYFLVLPWHFVDEFQVPYRSFCGRGDMTSMVANAFR